MSVHKPDADDMDRTFALLEKVAAAGERCPINTQSGGPREIRSVFLTALARAGRIRVEIGRHNWRVVVILVGPNAGKHTALPAKEKWRPYKIITDETRVHGIAERPQEKFRHAPSAPRSFG